MTRKREEARLQNLELLVAEAGSAVKLARRAHTSESYLSQIRCRLPTAKGGARGVGDALTQKLERAMGKPHGWMDEFHAHPSRQILRGRRHRYPDRSHYGDLHPLISWASAVAPAQADDHTQASQVQELLPCPVPCSEDTFVLRVENAGAPGRCTKSRHG